MAKYVLIVNRHDLKIYPYLFDNLADARKALRKIRNEYIREVTEWYCKYNAIFKAKEYICNDTPDYFRIDTEMGEFKAEIFCEEPNPAEVSCDDPKVTL